MLHTPIGMGNTACVAAAPYQVMARKNKHPQDDGGTQDSAGVSAEKMGRHSHIFW